MEFKEEREIIRRAMDEAQFLFFKELHDSASSDCWQAVTTKNYVVKAICHDRAVQQRRMAELVATKSVSGIMAMGTGPIIMAACAAQRVLDRTT